MANISLVNKNASADKTGTGQSYTIASTTAGNLLVVLLHFRTNSTDRVTSITNAASNTFVSSGALSTNATNNRSVQIWHCLSVSAGQTSITINQGGTGVMTVTAFEYHATTGVFILDVAGGTTNGLGTPVTFLHAGPSLVTTGINDVLVGFYGTSGAFESIASPFTSQQNDGYDNSINDAMNKVAATYQAVVTETGQSYYQFGMVAFSVPVTCALTGTATASITETDIVTGGKTLILTLQGDTWIA